MKTLLTFFCLISSLGFAAESPLKSYKINPQAISISGVSSGGFMAVQMGVAYSKVFSRVSSVAGGVYWCAQGDAKRAQSICMAGPKAIDVNEQIKQARVWEKEGAIDSLDNLKKQKIFLFASPQDVVTYPENGDKLLEFYKNFTEEKNIKLEKSLQAAHGFPTIKNGNPCATMGVPWILKCGYDLAGEILEKTNLNPKTSPVAANLLSFSQKEFGGDVLYPTGWVYVPKACAKGEMCSLHVALHGCQMNPDFIQNKFVTLAGYNDWAESNKIIVLYPQSSKSASVNPFGCWDWIGYTGENYATQNGPQMKALKKMIDRISSS